MHSFPHFTEIEPCATDPCKNNGTCTADDDGALYCFCNTPHYGKYCENGINANRKREEPYLLLIISANQGLASSKIVF